MDEISERPRSRSLPAPTGPRAPTGPVPLTLPDGAIPPPVAAQPVVPYLPAVAPKVTAPTTGPVATTLLPTAAQVEFALRKTVDEPPKRRRRKLLIVLGVIVVLPLLLGVVFRDSAFVGRFTGKGYDTNPLPVASFPQPALAGAVYTLTTQNVAVSDGLPTVFWRTERDEVDFKTKLAKLTIDRAKSTVIGGTIGTAQSTSPPLEMMVDPNWTYYPGESPTGPWTREPNEPGWGILTLLSSHEVLMYQDVIDPVLRSQTPTSVVHEAVHDVPVTTYSYTFTFGEFYESAPRMFDMVRMMDGNAGADASVVLTVSLDDQWMVRYLDVNLDFHAVLEYKAESDADTPYPYRYTIDVVSTSEDPPAIALPTNIVDATTTTSTTTAPVPVAP